MASSPNKTADFVGVRLLVFRIGELTCAAEAAAVREVLPAQAATRVPGAAEAVAGLINVRGSVITLVDGRRALGRPPAADQGSIVLFEVGARTVGLAVDEVLDQILYPAVELSGPRDWEGLDPRMLRGAGRREGLVFVVLDIDALLGPLVTA